MNFKHYAGLALLLAVALIICIPLIWALHQAGDTFTHASIGIFNAGAALITTTLYVLMACIIAAPIVALLYGIFHVRERRKYGWHFLRADRHGNYKQPLNLRTGTLVRADPGNYPALPENYHNAPHITGRTVEALPAPEEITSEKMLPDHVLYDDVRPLVPAGRVLVGVGTEGVQHEDEWARGLIWIAGSSSAGKTNTTIVRVDESYERGFTLLGIDPHAFKPDSFKNAVGDYLSRFQCIAQKEEEIREVLRYYLSKFLGRRDDGADCDPVHLYIDEVSSLTTDKPANPIQEENRALIMQLARMAGEEMRGFNMGITMISQTGTRMAWLRKYALMVLGHKVTMMNERQLVCNERTEIAREMDSWPKGRTVAYGVALPGVYVVQQPLLVRPTRRTISTPKSDPLQPVAFRQNETSVSADETPLEANPKIIQGPFRVSETEELPRSKKEVVPIETKRTILRMHKEHMPLRKIARYVGLSGEKYELFKQACQELGIETQKKAEEA